MKKYSLTKSNPICQFPDGIRHLQRNRLQSEAAASRLPLGLRDVT